MHIDRAAVIVVGYFRGGQTRGAQEPQAKLSVLKEPNGEMGGRGDIRHVGRIFYRGGGGQGQRQGKILATLLSDMMRISSLSHDFGVTLF